MSQGCVVVFFIVAIFSTQKWLRYISTGVKLVLIQIKQQPACEKDVSMTIDSLLDWTTATEIYQTSVE